MRPLVVVIEEAEAVDTVVLQDFILILSQVCFLGLMSLLHMLVCLSSTVCCCPECSAYMLMPYRAVQGHRHDLGWCIWKRIYTSAHPVTWLT